MSLFTTDSDRLSGFSKARVGDEAEGGVEVNGIDSRISRRRAINALGGGAAVSLLAPATVAARTSDRFRLEQAVEHLRMAMVSGDRPALADLLHDRLNYMHSSGHSQSKADLLVDHANQRFFASLTFRDVAVDIVESTGSVTLTVDQVKTLPGGKTRGSRIKVMQIWVKSADRWQLLARMSAIIYSPLPTRPAQRPPDLPPDL